MLIIILEYTCNMVIHIHSNYTFINSNILVYVIFVNATIPLRTHKIQLCILIRLKLNWSHLQLMGHKLFFLDANQTKCCSHERMKTTIVAN
jgi:hypothetical protein